MRYLYLLFSLALLSLHPQPTWLKIQLSGNAQGTTYHITYYASDSTITQFQIDSILAAIDTSLSIYNPQSLITRFNTSNTGIVMDHHFAAVVKKSLETFRQTSGIFDITIAPHCASLGLWSKENKRATGFQFTQSPEGLCKLKKPYRQRKLPP